MTSPQIKIMISLASISIVYAFICQIRLSQKARKLSKLLENKCPDLWAELNFVAKNSNGGLPGIKILYRNKTDKLPKVDRQYEQLRFLERQLLSGIAIGICCIGLIAVGLNYFGWHW